ncbi:MFS transporter [Chloroflexota bacterium]
MTASENTIVRRVTPINLAITFLGFLDTHMLIPVIALYASSLGASLGSTGLIIGLYSITNTPANIIFGRLVDKFGSRRLLIFGLLGDSIGMFLYSLCRLPLHLSFVRAFHGISGGLVGPATLSVTAKQAHPTQKGRAMGYYGMSIGTATLVGYGLSSILVSVSGYNLVFYIGALLLLVGVILALLMPGEMVSADISTEASRQKVLNKVSELVRRRGLVASYSSIFALYFTFGGVVTLLPLHVKGLGMDAFHVGLLLATFSITFILLQLTSGFLSDKTGRKAPASIGLCLCAVTMALLPASQTFVTLVVVMVLYGAAYASIFPSTLALLADHTSTEEYGTATGIFHALLTSGVAVGAPVIGWIAGQTTIGFGLIVSGLVAILVMIVVLLKG